MTRQQIIRAFISRNKWMVGATLLAAIVNSLLNVVIPLSIGKFYELALNESGSKSKLLDKAGLHIGDLSSFFIFFFSLVVARALFGFLELYCTEMVEEKMVNDTRQQLFQSQLNQTLESFQSKQVGKYLLRYSSDLSAIQNYITKGSIKFIADILFFVFTFCILLLLNKSLALIVLLAFVLVGIIIYFLTTRQKAPSEQRRRARSAMFEFVETRLNTFITIKALNRVEPELEQFRKRSNTLYVESKSYHLWHSFINSLLPALFFAVLGIAMWSLVQGDGADVIGSQSTLLVFILMLLYSQSVFKRLLRVPSVRQQGIISFNNLLSVMNMPAEALADKEVAKNDIKGQLKLESISFGYKEGNAVLNDFSAHFKPKSVTLISGAQGSGKSTLVKLLLALYRPVKGSIFLDDKNYAQMSEHAIRKSIAVVSEEIPLLGNTVFKVVSYSRNPDKRAKVNEVLKKLNIRFQSNDDDNLDYELSNGARNVSANERKMLQFARALLTRKKILVLDDPFVGLSTDSAATVVKLLNEMKQEKTIILLCNELPQELLIDKTIWL